ncbi:hypothetical protein Mgra_00009882 [Meloidogyne graminicola]|uniref:GRANULINS domain-containing protein n=1 Tax=Meloidogyne graminicola TaxID=189291 RepID=A0A8S9Z6M9_9BILA|nr:hypothetical protein Mgra_00009882 [Meloidogyne graminicola]
MLNKYHILLASIIFILISYEINKISATNCGMFQRVCTDYSPNGFHCCNSQHKCCGENECCKKNEKCCNKHCIPDNVSCNVGK